MRFFFSDKALQMDITLAKTFLAITELGNFAKASERLYVTQSTISTRIKQLEDLLGQTLFQRSKSGAVLTPAGLQFKPFAEKMIQTWEQACQEIALPHAFEARLRVGAQHTLWQHLVVNWLDWMQDNVPDYAVMAQIGSGDNLLRRLLNGLLDLVITYTPQSRTGLIIEEIMEEKLVLVSDSRTLYGPEQANYIFVDWGPEYKMDHAGEFPKRSITGLTTNHGPLALQHLLKNGGSTYLPLRMVKPHLHEGTLHLIESEAFFTRTVYAAYLEDNDDPRFLKAFGGFKECAKQAASHQI